ncbi:radical SAM protein [Streptomyces sp. JNUCC 64]
MTTSPTFRDPAAHHFAPGRTRIEPGFGKELRFLWLDLTRKCQLECTHCYNSSGPTGKHGDMARSDWLHSIDQAVKNGVTGIQLIGGEPMMHPDAREITAHALESGVQVEVYSNLVHVTNEWWKLMERDGVSLATSYYSNRAEEHNGVTGRPSHGRTRANIARAFERGIPIRVGIVSDNPDASEAAERDIRLLGVTHVSTDHVRPFGRAAIGRVPSLSGLCGHCGDGRAAIGPNGDVSPCVFSAWMNVGNVRAATLAEILTGPAMAEAAANIQSVHRGGQCDPSCDPNAECTPGYPPSECTPRN